MVNLYKRVVQYNVINVVTVIVFGILQFLNIFVWSNWYLFLLDEESLMWIILWPLFAMFSTIMLNRRFLRNFIHKQNKELYLANNINIDDAVDDGSLSEEVWKALPIASVSRPRYTRDADRKFFGELNDIGIKYSIDDFRYKIKHNVSDKTETLVDIRAEALSIHSDNYFFGNDCIVYVSNKIKFESREIVQDTEIALEYGELFYNNDNVDINIINKIKKVISSNPNYFGKNNSNIVIFHKNTFINISKDESKFKMKLAFIISKQKLERIISDQKGQVYRFNQMLVDITRIFSES